MLSSDIWSKYGHINFYTKIVQNYTKSIHYCTDLFNYLYVLFDLYIILDHYFLGDICNVFSGSRVFSRPFVILFWRGDQDQHERYN